MTPRLLPAQGRPATPWKNGKGMTREIAAFPPGAAIDDFEWRVSIADVREGGPFSNFPDIDRRLAVLEGAIRLNVGDEAAVTLVPGSDPIAFPGDIPCQADISDGAARDLNVMTRRGRFSSHMTLVAADGPVPIPANACTAILVALCDLTLQIGQAAIALKSFDAAQFDGPMPDGVRLLCGRSGAGGKGLYNILIFASEPPGAAKISESRQ